MVVIDEVAISATKQSDEFNAVFDLMEQKEIDMRSAAYALALNRIGEATESQGMVRCFAGEKV